MSSDTAKLLRLHKKISITDISNTKSIIIEKYNRSEIKNRRIFRKLYKPVSVNVTLETFIIPVNNGTVTGYLYRKSNINSNLTPLIIYFHEGGWMLGNMEYCKAICNNICNSTGGTVLAVDYRLAPEYKFPIPVEDCYNAFLWAEQGAKYWKTDPSRIYLMGACTGANLAIAVSRLARDNKAPRIAGLILEDPLADCRLRTDSIELHKNHPILKKSDLTFFIQNYQRESRDILDPLFSPLLGLDHSRLPETLIFSSKLSPLYDDAHLFAKTLKNADTPVKLIEEENKFHCFMKYPDSERFSDEMATIKSFIDGKPVENVELLTRHQRAKLNRKKSKTVTIQDNSL